MEPRCDLYGCTRSGRLRPFTGCAHRFHFECMGNLGVGMKAACPICSCATCKSQFSGRRRLLRPCRCTIHDTYLCRGGLGGLTECGRCASEVSAVSEPLTEAQVTEEYRAAHAAPVEAPAVTVAPAPGAPGSLLPSMDLMMAGASSRPEPARRAAPQPAPAADSGKRPWSLFGLWAPAVVQAPRPSASEIIQALQLERFAGIKRLEVTFGEADAAGILLRTLVDNGATWTDLVQMGITKEDVLRDVHFDVPALAKADCTFERLATQLGVGWPDLRPKKLNFFQLKALKPTMYELCSRGFEYVDLLGYKDITVASWTKEPFQLDRASWLLLPGQAYTLALTPQRLEELRTRNGTNWSYESMRDAFWPGERVPTEFVLVFGASILPSK